MNTIKLYSDIPAIDDYYRFRQYSGPGVTLYNTIIDQVDSNTRVVVEVYLGNFDFVDDLVSTLRDTKSVNNIVIVPGSDDYFLNQGDLVNPHLLTKYDVQSVPPCINRHLDIINYTSKYKLPEKCNHCKARRVCCSLPHQYFDAFGDDLVTPL